MSSFQSSCNSSISSSTHTSETRARKESYFDIDDILSTQERVPVVFRVPVLHLGYLDPSSGSEHIETGAKMEIPFWMARALNSSGKHLVSIDLPQKYKESQREILAADPAVVDLHKWGPYFYKYGMLLSCFEHPEAADIASSLLQTLQRRFCRIMDFSQNAGHEDIGAVTRRLDNLEMSIFSVGQKSRQDQLLWEQRRNDKLLSSKVIQNQRKRKRIQLEDM